MQAWIRRSVFAFSWVGIVVLSNTAYGFNTLSHEQATRSAFTYLSQRSRLPATSRWLEHNDIELVRRLLERAAVDADFRNDIWLDAWFHEPFAAAEQGKSKGFFTSLLHFINITKPGRYWEHDGYAYRHSSRQGNDFFIALPSTRVRGDKSAALGGRSPAGTGNAPAPGMYNLGFKGSERQWRKLFFGRNWARNAVFPPADSVAQSAYNAMLGSARADATVVTEWRERFPVLTGIKRVRIADRRYWRAEVAGLPSQLDLLGIALHLAQDMAVPQHALGTTDFCHQEFEALFDRLNCNSSKPVDTKEYETGDFDGERSGCQSLYDPALVDSLSAEHPALDPTSMLGVADRLREVARLSARWQWRFDSEEYFEPSYDGWRTRKIMATELPDGSYFASHKCGGFLSQDAVRRQIRYQYNLAVALTATIIEVAARDYEFKSPGFNLLGWLPWSH